MLVFAFAVVSIFCIAFIVWRSRVGARAELSRSLGLALFSVRLPRTEEAEKEEVSYIRERIGHMEQVFAQLATIKESGWKTFFSGKPFFAFEIAVPAVGTEAVFYLAVPRRYAAAVQRAVEGVYADARVERVKDYSLFHETGGAAVLGMKAKSVYLPLRTYQSVESDPLASVLNAFGKINRENQSLALQIVCQKAPGYWNKRLAKVASHLRDGKKMDKALREAGKSKTVKLFEELRTNKNQKEETPHAHDQDLVTTFSRKAEKTLFAVNVRIAASAESKEEAETLAQGLATSFAQFTDERTNQVSFVKKYGRFFSRAVYQFSFRTPEKKSQLILSTEELASFFHFPNTALGAPHVAVEKSKSAPAPASLARDGLLLGENVYRDMVTPVYMTEEDRARHFYIIGQTGTGKSYFMRNLVMQDIQSGKGVCMIDPHGDLTESLMAHVPRERLEDVIYFDPGDVERPLGLNMLEYDVRFPEQKTFVVNELLEIFNKLYDMKVAGGPMFEQYFRNATMLVMDDPGSGNTLLEVGRVFSDKAFRDMKISRCASPLVRTFWKDVAEKAGGEASLVNMVPYISSKFDTFLSNDIMRPIVAQEKSAFNFREIMDSGKILLINLSKGRLGEINSSLIGLIMVGKILMASFSRTDIPEADRKPFYLYIDEFQNVTTNSISTILSEARKYRLSLTVAHQYLGQLEENIKKSVFGNIGSHAAFRVGAEDGEYLDNLKLFAPVFGSRDLINIDNKNCYVKLLVNGQSAEPFSMKVLPAGMGDESMVREVKEFSRTTYGRNRNEVEEEIRGKFDRHG